MILPRTPRLYNSPVWLKYQYVTLKKTPDEIAKEQNVGRATIYRKLKEFGLIR